MSGPSPGPSARSLPTPGLVPRPPRQPRRGRVQPGVSASSECSCAVGSAETGRAVVPGLAGAEVATAARPVVAGGDLVERRGVRVRIRRIRHGRAVAGERVDRGDEWRGCTRATDDAPPGKAVAEQLVDAGAVRVIDRDTG